MPKNASVRIDVEAVLAQMTLDEKIDMVGGKDNWITRGVARLNVPETMVADGPIGLRKNVDTTNMLSNTMPATCFPTTAVLASTWNRDMVAKVAAAIGDECRREHVDVILGPGNNIKRTPLCGRNFEYFSEDPYLGAQLAGSFVRGVQSRGVGATLKHFCANNQETLRLSIDAHVDERALREVYLAAFESVVRDAKPWCIMSCYNQVNGEYVVSSKRFLTEILRNEWGYDGIVMSDWAATDDRAKALTAGMDLEMPGTCGVTEKRLHKLAARGELDLAGLDDCVRRLLHYVNRALAGRQIPDVEWDFESHHALAREAAADGIVLLTNESHALPLKPSSKVAVIGEFAVQTRSQGNGSSRVNQTQQSLILDEMRKLAGDDAHLTYAQGYTLDPSTTTDELMAAAVAAAKAAEVAVVLVGIPAVEESEGYDREHLDLPAHHNALVEAVAAVNPNTVVVLTMSSAVVMPWRSKVRAIVAAYLPGQAAGGAIADVLYGKVCPSGKLAETFPLRLEDTPAFLSFPGNKEIVTYRESIYVGYRYYDTRRMEVMFPFGHGLSYTTFEHSGAKVARSVYKDNEIVEAEVTVRNTGAVAGAEVVQLYVHDVKSTVDRPEKELKGFEKVFLQPGESKTVKFSLDRRAFAYYDVARKDWVVEEGDFKLIIGTSSRNVWAELAVHVSPAVPPPPPHFTANTPIVFVRDFPPTSKMAAAALPSGMSGADNNPGFTELMLKLLGSFPLRLRTQMFRGEKDADFDIDALDAYVAELNAVAAASVKK